MQYPTKIGQTAIDIIARSLAGQAVPTSVAVDVGIIK